MITRFKCPQCGCFAPATQSDWIDAVVCPKGHRLVLQAMDADGVPSPTWEECRSCGAFDCYSQKAIPKKLFLGLLICGLVIILYVLSENWFWGMGLLALLTIADVILFKILPTVLVCYGCQSETSIESSLAARPFDHHTAERYRKK